MTYTTLITKGFLTSRCPTSLFFAENATETFIKRSKNAFPSRKPRRLTRNGGLQGCISCVNAAEWKNSRPIYEKAQRSRHLNKREPKLASAIWSSALSTVLFINFTENDQTHPPLNGCYSHGAAQRETYHSGRVIPRSANPRRCTGKWRALARATSGSLTTRIPKAFELRTCDEQASVRVERPWTLRTRNCLRANALKPKSNKRGGSPGSQFKSQGRVGVRANPNDRTYRRSGLEQKSYELRGNRGSKLKQNPRFIFEGKSCTSPNLGETASQKELNLKTNSSMCVRCQKNETYMDLDICEPCVSEIAGLNQ